MTIYQVVIDTNVIIAALKSRRGVSFKLLSLIDSSLFNHNSQGVLKTYRRFMMETISVTIPESVHKSLKKLAEKDHVPIAQFITTAISEKISAFMTKEYLENRGKRGSKKKFMDVLARVPDVEPEEYDKL